ncbi:protein SPEAR3-like [Rhododendron vialii]|uniref:protein SPEAR3-like n=1 Tax=Rhododendron vialii TaxID=182163 RepID=UPI00265ECF93|nr:protein SPEAR3-like [Rhododendron vialii]
MGSSYYGEPNYTGNERSAAAGGGGSSSRKGNNKKGGSNNNSEKAPKQPQRGLGVAQLEKIRLNSQLIPPSTNYHLPTHYPTQLLNQEEIRMPTAYSSMPTSSASFPYAPAASSYGFYGHQNVAMGLGQFEEANVRYPESQPSSTIPRFQSQYPNSGTLETPYFTQPSMTRHHPVEDSFQKKRKKDSIGSSSQNSNTSDNELDLELKL